MRYKYYLDINLQDLSKGSAQISIFLDSNMFKEKELIILNIETYKAVQVITINENSLNMYPDMIK